MTKHEQRQIILGLLKSDKVSKFPGLNRDQLANLSGLSYDTVRIALRELTMIDKILILNDNANGFYLATTAKDVQRSAPYLRTLRSSALGYIRKVKVTKELIANIKGANRDLFEGVIS